MPPAAGTKPRRRGSASSAPSSLSKRSRATSSSDEESEAVPRNEIEAVATSVPFVSTATCQGPREYQEDRLDARMIGRTLAVGVFDGHGGNACSEFLRSHLLARFLEPSLVAAAPNANKPVDEALIETFTAADKEFCDSEKETPSGAGSTATVAVLRAVNPSSTTSATTASAPPQTAIELTVAAAGDSRAALLRRGARSLEFLSTVHHGSRRDERRRIERLGGVVLFDEIDKLYRVGGVLAVTRSIGDAYLKPFVTGEPEVKRVECKPGDVLVLASDGLWDHAGDKDIVEELMTMESTGDGGEDRRAERLVELALQSGSDDNVTVLVVDVTAVAETLLVG